jgi:pectin methylesterase-like acyl-CoA thioesterase
MRGDEWSGLQGTCFNGGCHCDVCASGCLFTSVQAAIDDPGAPTTITVCEGTYTGDITINRNLSLTGAGDGANPAFNTILHGTGHSSVVTIGASGTMTVQRLRITGGSANQGGGVFIAAGTHTLSECTIIGNTSVTSGGGIFNDGSLMMDSCSVKNNQSLGSGGIVSDGTLSLQSSILVRNTTTGGAGSQGGGLLNLSGAAHLTNCDVVHNTASSGGSGIYEADGDVTLDVSVVDGNFTDNCAPAFAIDGCGP